MGLMSYEDHIRSMRRREIVEQIAEYTQDYDDAKVAFCVIEYPEKEDDAEFTWAINEMSPEMFQAIVVTLEDRLGIRYNMIQNKN